jgi:Txe/YoeB family toxin of Txe-Axe toxin-antitoxin module
MLEKLKQSPLLRAACGGPVRYTGRIDEVAYWSRRMTADERAVLMYEGMQGTLDLTYVVIEMRTWKLRRA